MLGMNSRMRPRRMKFQKLLTWMNCKRLWAKATKSGSGLPRITGVRASWLGLWETGVRKRSSACGGLSCWQSFGMERDGYTVYPVFIEDDSLLSKTYMTRIEGENTRLRHYLARLHRKTLCYSSRLRCWVFSAFAAALSERWHRTYSRLIITFQQHESYMSKAYPSNLLRLNMTFW